MTLSEDERKAALFKARSETTPPAALAPPTTSRRAALAVLANGFLTGASIPVDGGEHLVETKEGPAP